MKATNSNELIDKVAVALDKASTIDELAWLLVDQVISKLSCQDCVIYLFSKKRNSLLQVAAFGAKRKLDNSIRNPIRIDPGEGIVGRVFQSGVPRIVRDTSRDSNYIIDDRFRLSEISIPILNHGKVIGVIDSEHPSENFYTNKDKEILTQFAVLFASKIEQFNFKFD